jgi:hypothetical protein
MVLLSADDIMVYSVMNYDVDILKDLWYSIIYEILLDYAERFGSDNASGDIRDVLTANKTLNKEKLLGATKIASYNQRRFQLKNQRIV